MSTILFEPFFLINAVLALVFGGMLLRASSPTAIIGILLAYVSLHHLDAVYLLFTLPSPATASTRAVLTEFHLHQHLLSVIRGLTILLIAYGCMGRLLLKQYSVNALFFADHYTIGLVMFLGIAGVGVLQALYAQQGAHALDWGLLKQAASPFFMFAFSLAVMALSSLIQQRGEDEQLLHWFRPLLPIALGVVLVGIYELLSGKVWSYLIVPGGVVLPRVSSTLYNPNMFGLWCIGALLFFMAFYNRHHDTKACVLATLFLAIGLFSSGSRSAFLVLLVVLIVIPLLAAIGGIKWRNYQRLLHLPALMLVALFALCFTVKAVAAQFPMLALMQSLSALASRMASTLPVVGLYLLHQLHLVYPQGHSVLKEVLDHALVSGQTLPFADSPYAMLRSDFQAIDGRIGEGAQENAYIYFWRHNRLLLAAIVASIGYLLFQGLRKIRKTAAVEGLLPMIGFISVVLGGLMIRFYGMFPAWMLAALSFAFYLRWLKTEAVPSVAKGYSRVLSST